MVAELLGFWTPGPIELIIILVVLTIPALVIILFFGYVLRSSKGRRRLRLEVAKLTEEVKRLREEKIEKRELTSKD